MEGQAFLFFPPLDAFEASLPTVVSGLIQGLTLVSALLQITRSCISKMASYNSEAPVLDTYQAVVSAYCDFLTVAIHTILYERNVYPQTSFIKARKYNYPVRQSRHPKLCKWIMDAVSSVEVEMLKVKKHPICGMIIS